MRNILVAGNWKMNGATDRNAELVGGITAGAPANDQVELLVCPPFPYLSQVAELVAGSSVALGAQNVSAEASGAFTGEVAADMLLDLGCRFALVGHSERRTLYGETDADVAAKTRAALAAGLTPVVCVGETLEQRQAGSTEAVIRAQIDAVLAAVGIEGIGRSVVAYEPVWAIGTGEVATPEQAQAVHAAIRAQLAQSDASVAEGVQILYGGSMKGENAAGLLAMEDIDGGLIGGASLKSADFLAIAAAAAELRK